MTAKPVAALPDAELLPCPFCGKSPTLIAETERDGFVREYVVHCDTCAIGHSGEYESDAIAAWNRRAALPEAPCLTERVLDAADQFCPKCGHNRDKSSVSSIDEGDGRRCCQMCGTEWVEGLLAAQAPADRAVMQQALQALEDVVKRNEIQSWFNVDKQLAAIASLRTRIAAE